jgi:hypothetical protein
MDGSSEPEARPGSAPEGLMPRNGPAAKEGEFLTLVSDPASGSEEPLARRERSLTRRAKEGVAIQNPNVNANLSIGALALDGEEEFRLINKSNCSTSR